ncbi:MAG: FAD binding domain-containing protein [Nocardioides sp.]
MKPAPFAYVRPGSLADAVAALAGDPEAKVLAGGQSLIPLLNMRLAAPGCWSTSAASPTWTTSAPLRTGSGSGRWPGTPPS